MGRSSDTSTRENMNRIRRSIVDKAKRTHIVAKRFHIVTLVSVVVMAAMAVALYLSFKQRMGYYGIQEDAINIAGLRRYQVSQIQLHSRSRQLLSAGYVARKGDVYARSQLLRAVEDLQELTESLKDYRFSHPASVVEQLNEPHVPTKLLIGGEVIEFMYNLDEAVTAYSSRAREVHALPLNEVTVSNEAFFYLQMNMDALAHAMNQTAHSYARDLADQAENNLSLIFLICGCVVTVLMLTVVVYPVVSRVQSGKERVMMMFVMMPRYFLKRFRSTCTARLAVIDGEENIADEDMHFEAEEIDVTEEMMAEFKATTWLKVKLLLKTSPLFAVFTIFFFLAHFVALGSLRDSLPSVPWILDYSGFRRAASSVYISDAREAM